MPKRRTLKQADEELARMTKKYEFVRAQLTAIQSAFSDVFQGVFVSADEAAEIARDAVSERIW